MKITIDTKEDSSEDIRKVIAMLNSFVGELSEVKPMDLFGSAEEPSTESGESSSLFNLFENKEEGDKEEDPEKIKIIEY
jgi:hypothetical protein